MTTEHKNAVEIEIDGEKWGEAYAAGFELYLPPSPMLNEKAKPPNAGRFVIVDDANDTFYDVSYDDAKTDPSRFVNEISWTDLALHKVVDPAIVLPSLQWESLHDEKRRFAYGFLVVIASRKDNIFYARRVGSVFVRNTVREQMNWPVLEACYGAEVAAELRNGLLRQMWNKRSEDETISYKTPVAVLKNLKHPWYRDGEVLNWYLDHQFAGGQVIESQQKWRLQAWEPVSKEESEKRAAEYEKKRAG